MEPSDFDKTIRAKLDESHELHKDQMDAARPFVWSAIRMQTQNRRSLAWYHLAAAVLFMILGFSVILYRVMDEHTREIKQLSEKIDELHSHYLLQRRELYSKDTLVESLGNELRNMEEQLTRMQEQNLFYPKETTVYRIDTIYVNHVQEIATVPELSVLSEVPDERPGDPESELPDKSEERTLLDEAIFPSSSYTVGNRSSGKVDVIILSFPSSKE